MMDEMNRDPLVKSVIKQWSKDAIERARERIEELRAAPTWYGRAFLVTEIVDELEPDHFFGFLPEARCLVVDAVADEFDLWDGGDVLSDIMENGGPLQ